MTSIKQIAGWCAISATAAASISMHANAQEQSKPYPPPIVKIVVPAAAGGSSDIVARILAQKLGEKWKNAVVVENRPGAGGNIGVAAAVKLPPDGSSLLLTSSHALVNPVLYDTVTYNMVRDFVPITNIANSPNAIAIHPSLKVADLKGLVALIKDNPDKFSYASPGAGSTQNLTCELLKQRDKLKWQQIPFNGGGPTVNAVLGNTIPITCMSLPPLVPHVTGGKLKLLAVTGAARLPSMPNVPTMKEAGYDNFEVYQMQGLFAPAGTPADIISKIYEDTRRVMASPDVVQALALQGNIPVLNSPTEFSQFVKSETSRWAEVIKEGGVKPE